MSDEIDPGSGDDEVIEDGGDEGVADPAAGASGTGTGAGASGVGAGTGAAAAARQAVFTAEQQTHVNNIVRNRLREERARWEKENSGAAAAASRQPARETPQSSFTPETRAALDAYMEASLAPYRAQAVRGEIDSAFTEFQGKHPELADKATRDLLIETILSWGEDLVQKAPMNWLLEQGWLAMKYTNFDEEKFFTEKQGKYLAAKSERARKVPNAQGSGGKATTTPKPRGKEWKDADSAMRALVDEENAARA